jgi:hypothetical protein
MNRRKFLKKSITGGTIVAFGGGYFWLKSGDGVENLTIEMALKHLDKLKDKKLTSSGQWKPAQIFNHLAQSIEFSMISYPQHKSDLFKNTLGLMAFSVFVTRGQMTHNLSEPIPGAAKLLSKEDTQVALERLRKSLLDFENYSDPLKPHFAYGKLTKKEYTFAHIMHIKNHLEEILYHV